MSRLQPILDKLAAGERVENYKESGNSMSPIVKHRQPVTLEPVDATKLERGDIVLVRVRGNTYTHKVLAVGEGKVLIGNNHGGVNGWAPHKNVFGIVTEIDGTAVSSAREKVKATS